MALSKKLGAQFGGVVTDRVIDSGGLLKAHDVERYPTAVETGAAIAGAASGLTAGRSRPGAKIRYRAPVMTNVETPPPRAASPEERCSAVDVELSRLAPSQGLQCHDWPLIGKRCVLVRRVEGQHSVA